MCYNIFHSADADSWFGAERADERSDCAWGRRQGEQYSNGTTVLPTQFNFESWVLWQLFNFILDIFQELLPRPSNNTTCAASEEERRLDSEIWWRVPSLLDANHGQIMWRRNMWTFEMVTFYDTFHHSSASTYLNDMPWYSILGCQSLLCHDYQSSLLYEILYEVLCW